MGGASLADTMLAAAQNIAAGGWPVFPCEIGGKRPKVPRGFLAATTGRNQVFNWWAAELAGCNIAVPTGVAFDVLDVDNHGERGNGWAAFSQLKAAGLLAGAFRLVRTPGGGLHVYFAPSGQRCGSLKAQHTDFKALGGYVLVPPSQIGRRRYEILDDRPPTGATFDWPAAVHLLRPPQPVPAGQHRGGGSVKHLPDWMAQQAEGNRNASLFWAACRAAEAGDQAVLTDLAAAAVHAGLDQAEAHRTIASAVRRVGNGG